MSTNLTLPTISIVLYLIEHEGTLSMRALVPDNYGPLDENLSAVPITLTKLSKTERYWDDGSQWLHMRAGKYWCEIPELSQSDLIFLLYSQSAKGYFLRYSSITWCTNFQTRRLGQGLLDFCQSLQWSLPVRLNRNLIYKLAAVMVVFGCARWVLRGPSFLHRRNGSWRWYSWTSKYTSMLNTIARLSSSAISGVNFSYCLTSGSNFLTLRRRHRILGDETLSFNFNHKSHISYLWLPNINWFISSLLGPILIPSLVDLDARLQFLPYSTWCMSRLLCYSMVLVSLLLASRRSSNFFNSPI